MTDTHIQEKDSLEASANQVAYVQGVQLGAFAYTMKGSWVTNPDGSVSAPAFLTAFTPSTNLSAAISQWLAQQPTTPPAVIATFSVTVNGDTVSIDDQTANATDELFDFGDGSTEDTMGDRTHTYTQSGDFTIRLTATNPGGTSTATQDVTITIPDTGTPVPPPATSLAGQTVTLTGTLADGTAINVTATPGQRVPLVTGQIVGSVMYHADGLSVCIENAYAGLTSDLKGHFTLSAGGTQLFDGDLTIWAYARTRPFWLADPALKASPDLSLFAPLGGGATASMYASYQTADNGPMGIGLACKSIGNEGERADLGGELPQWDADYLTNPSSNNAAVVRGMADASAPWACHVIDPTTNDLISVHDYTKLSMYSAFRGISGNPIAKYSSACPTDLDQCQTHAVNYCALSCAIYGTDYDREEIAFRSNFYNCLYQNYSYRSPGGSCVFTHVAPRGRGRGLIALLFAAKYAPDPWKPYFQAWIDEAAQIGVSIWINKQTGIAIDQTSGGYFNGSGWAPWQQHNLIFAVGLAILHGNTSFQPILDYFEPTLSSSVLDAQHEFATIYSLPFRDTSGNMVSDWKGSLAAYAAQSAAMARALQSAEGSQALQDAMGWDNQPGDFAGYPTAPTGYAAMAQGAFVMNAKYATNQTRAQAALAKFQQWQRINYGGNPKYNVQLPT